MYLLKLLGAFSVAFYIGFLVFSFGLKNKLHNREDLAEAVSDSIIRPIESFLPESIEDVITHHADSSQEEEISSETESVELPEIIFVGDDIDYKSKPIEVDNDPESSLAMEMTIRKLDRVKASLGMFQILNVHLNNIQILNKEDEKEGKVSTR